MTDLIDLLDLLDLLQSTKIVKANIPYRKYKSHRLTKYLNS